MKITINVPNQRIKTLTEYLDVAHFDTDTHVIQISSGITCGRVLNGELYAQSLQKLIYLHLFNDCFMNTGISLQKFPQKICSDEVERNLHETVCNKCR